MKRKLAKKEKGWPPTEARPRPVSPPPAFLDELKRKEEKGGKGRNTLKRGKIVTKSCISYLFLRHRREKGKREKRRVNLGGATCFSSPFDI